MDYGYGNYSTTSYGAQGAADGGGFIAGEAASSQQGGKGYGKDTVRPLTIKQILDAQQPYPDSDFKVDGETISSITFVGQIRNITTQTTNITYKVDDGTGIIEAKQWIDNEASTSDQMDVDAPKMKLVENGYCRVWGRLKAFNNKRHVGAHVIRPITDYNEIHYHLLEATAVHLFFTKGPPNAAAQALRSRGAAANGVSGGHETGVDDRAMSSVTPLARRIWQALKNAESNEGLHVQLLASQLSAPVNDVYKAAEELVQVGAAYTTVDDQTWAILEF